MAVWCRSVNERRFHTVIQFIARSQEKSHSKPQSVDAYRQPAGAGAVLIRILRIRFCPPEKRWSTRPEPVRQSDRTGQKAFVDSAAKQKAAGELLKSSASYQSKKIIPANEQVRAINQLIDNLGGQASGLFGRGVDKANSAYKYILSWNPIFQTRNAIGTTLQGLSQMPSHFGEMGKYLGSYKEAYKMIRGKGNYQAGLYEDFAERGIFKQYGMFGSAKFNPFAKLANFSESVNRAAVALYKKGSGRSLAEAAEESYKVFYKYGKEYATPFENAYMKRMMPFYDFAKGQMQFWPKELTQNAGLWHSLYTIKRGSLPSDLVNNPHYRQDWEKICIRSARPAATVSRPKTS